MNKKQVSQLLTICSTAYPQLTITDELVEFWTKMLVDVPAQLATDNLKSHILTNRFPPTIAEIAKQQERDDGPYSDYKKQALDHMLYLEDVQSKAVKMPEYLRKLVEEYE